MTDQDTPPKDLSPQFLPKSVIEGIRHRVAKKVADMYKASTIPNKPQKKD